MYMTRHAVLDLMNVEELIIEAIKKNAISGELLVDKYNSIWVDNQEYRIKLVKIEN